MTSNRPIGVPEWLIIVGAGAFLLSLTVVAVFVPDIRWLHVFQGSIYVAAIALSLRHNRYGYFVGISAGTLWNYLLLFASPLISTLLAQLSRWMHGGAAPQPDLVLQGGGWVGNVMLIAGGAWAYLRLSERRRADVGPFVATFVVTTGYLLVWVAVLTPERLSLLRQGLHPHWP
jgi:hypothetical protein